MKCLSMLGIIFRSRLMVEKVGEVLSSFPDRTHGHLSDLSHGTQSLLERFFSTIGVNDGEIYELERMRVGL